MAKLSGGSRKLTTGSREYQRRVQEIDQMRASGKYSSVEMGSGGGYVAVEKSPVSHHPEELEAATILADHGYKVILKDERPCGFQISTPDGYIFTASFEQRTPQGNTVNNCQRCLEHARDKNAQIALIYDKYHNYHKQTVVEGIQQYKEHNAYRFQRIIIVTHDGNIHRHEHNK